MSIHQSVIWNWAGIIVIGLVSFITMPVMIHHLGSFYYGLWVVLNAFISYYGLFDFGISSGLRRFTSRLQGAEDPEALHQIGAAALHLSAAIAIIAIVATAVIAYVIPGIVRVPEKSAQLTQTLFGLMGVSVAIAFPARTLAAYLQGLERFDLYNIGLILPAALRGGCVVAALHMGYGVISVAAATLLGAISSLAFYCISVHVIDSRLFIKLGSFSWERMRELVGFSFFIFVQGIGDYFRFQMDSIVIARWLAVALVTPFSVTSTLMSYFMLVMSGVSAPMMSMACQLDGAQRLTESRRFFLSATKATAALAILGGILLVGNGKALLELWLGKDLLAAYPVLVILTLAFVSDLGQSPSVNLLRSRGQHRAMAYWTVVEGVANLGLSIYLAPRYGIMGVAAGTTIPMLVTKLIVQPWYTLKVAAVPAGAYLATICRPVAAGLICVVASRYLLSPASRPSLLFIRVTCQILLFAAVAFVLVLNVDERRSLLVRVTKRVRPIPVGT